MEIFPTQILGCYEIVPRIYQDTRGVFVKTFHEGDFETYGLATNFKEQYYSKSKRGVLRGLHFQTPPNDHVKLVYCTEGEVIDLVVDLRVNSPTYGIHQSFKVSGLKGNMIYIPRGLAHGFYVLSNQATMVYNVTSIHAPESDSGIHWNSVGYVWPDEYPMVSERDQSFIPFSEFNSKFYYDFGNRDE